jgi:glyoxylate/hydroxypyruvate reductase A
MRIVVTHPDSEARAQWVTELTAQLAARLPQAQVCAEGDPGHESARYAIGWLTPADFFDRHPHLKAFFSAGAGVDQVLAHPGLPAQLSVIRLEDAGMATQMVEYCCHEVFRLRGRFAAYEAQQKQGLWRELPPRSPGELRIGVLGMGVLGEQVARTVRSFGYPVTGCATRARMLADIPVMAAETQLLDFAAQSDVLILIAPLTQGTRHLIDARVFAALPAGAWIINVGRGALIDEAALLKALDGSQLGGATLDVFATEPLPADSPFWTHPRVRITPHIAAATRVPESAAQVADKITRLERGDTPSGLVDRIRGY